MNKLRFRLAALQFFLIFLFSLLVARFYIIQVDEFDKWKKIARRQHYFLIQEPAMRGTFFSSSLRKNHPEAEKQLVVEIEKFHLHIDPQSIPEKFKKKIEAQLITILGLPSSQKKFFSQQFYKKSRNRKLAMWLEKNQQEEVLNWWRPFARTNKIPHNALFFVPDYQRSYPYGSMLGQLLHTTRGCKNEEQEAAPTGGLELYFDSYLKGKPGKRRLMRSPKNSFETGEIITPPTKGADVYLTINHYIQAIVEEELERGVKKCQAKGGRAVMMDPKTGEILAIAHYPFFDPSCYKQYFNDPKLIAHTQLGAITDALEPGSVMKPFTICAALQANEELSKRGESPLFNPETKIATSDGRFPGRSRPLVDTRLHRFMNMNMALQKSANIYLARLVEKIIARLGNNWYRSILSERLGFGKKTLIEFPAETSGMLPEIGKCYPNGALEWSTSTPFSLAMGYNLQVNAIQLLRAYSVLANGGFLVQPTLVKRIVRTSNNGDKSILLDNTLPSRIQSFPRVFSKRIVETTVKAMKYTTKPGGSAPKAEIYGYTEAGKTSTAKKVIHGAYADIYRSTFIGFAPVNKPAFVLFVLMDEPKYGYAPGIGKTHHGGTCAAPVFSKIAKRVLAYLEIPQDDPFGYPKGDPRSDPTKADWVKESQKLQKLYEEWNH